MKTYYVLLTVMDEGKLHIVTANDEEHVKELINDFWFDQPVKYHEIREIKECEVLITKHIEHE
jgi:hypothetical protein